MPLLECQCERENCHGDRGCTRRPRLTVHTHYGGFSMCPECAVGLPEEYRTMPDTHISHARENVRMIETYRAHHITELQDIIRRVLELTGAHPDAIALTGGDWSHLDVSLTEETLSDGSKVYSLEA